MKIDDNVVRMIELGSIVVAITWAAANFNYRLDRIEAVLHLPPYSTMNWERDATASQNQKSLRAHPQSKGEIK